MSLDLSQTSESSYCAAGAQFVKTYSMSMNCKLEQNPSTSLPMESERCNMPLTWDLKTMNIETLVWLKIWSWVSKSMMPWAILCRIHSRFSEAAIILTRTYRLIRVVPDDLHDEAATAWKEAISLSFGKRSVDTTITDETENNTTSLLLERLKALTTDSTEDLMWDLIQIHVLQLRNSPEIHRLCEISLHRCRVYHKVTPISNRSWRWVVFYSPSCVLGVFLNSLRFLSYQRRGWTFRGWFVLILLCSH